MISFWKVMRTDMPTTHPLMGRLVKFILREHLGDMFDWFKNVGFGANPREYKGRFPNMQGFETCLKQSSRFRKGDSN